MWMILDYRCVVEITGADRRSFLQGLVTQDIFLVAPSQPLYSLFLTETGRFFCDFFIVEKGDALFLTPGCHSADLLLQKLSLYKLRSDVHVRLMEGWGLAVNVGSDEVVSSSGVVFKDPRHQSLGRVFLGSLSDLSEPTLDKNSYELQRLSCGVPEGPLDMEENKSIPLEYWMDELHAISWTKGCFLGQELTARTKYVGAVRKKALSFATEKPVSVGETLHDREGRGCGRILSAYRDHRRGFALVKMDVTDPFLALDPSNHITFSVPDFV